MSRLVSTAQGIGRLDGNLDTGTIALLATDQVDLGAALAAGLPIADIAGAAERERVAASDVELLATVPHPSKIWAVGFAYADHRQEVGHTSTAETPSVFLKAPSSTIGHRGTIKLPRLAPDRVDYEGELGVVIGRRASHVTVDEARDVIAGYTVCNDVSARDIQKGWLPGREPDVTAAKSFDTFTPMGPCLATLDEFDDPDDLALRTWVDGELRQDARTSALIFPIALLVAHLSEMTTLEPGDVVCTGTPAGVGHKQGKFLRPGSRVRIEIEGIGTLENTCA